MLEKFISYNYQANQIIIRCIEENKVHDEEIIKLTSHIINAQLIWNSRMDTELSPVPVFQIHPVADLQMLNEIAYKGTLRIFNRYKDEHHSNLISYKTTQGVPFESLSEDIILHICNHGTYHRGQIAKLLRAAGIAPPATDYIFLIRSQ